MVEQLRPYLERIASGQLIWQVDTMVIAETVWVLQGLKDATTGKKLFTRDQISHALKALMLTPGIETTERDLLLQSLTDYVNCKVDFVDAYLAAKSRASGNSVLTWNVKDFKK